MIMNLNMLCEFCSFDFFADVRLIYHRECEPLVCPSFSDLQGPWPEQAPVCASNGFTYGHIHQVRCLKDLQPGASMSNLIGWKCEKSITFFFSFLSHILPFANDQIFELHTKVVVHYMKHTVHWDEMHM